MPRQQETLQGMPARIIEELTRGKSSDVLIPELFNEVRFPKEEIEKELFSDLRERYSDFDELYGDTEQSVALRQKIEAYSQVELAKEKVVEQLITTVVGLSADIVEYNKKIEQCKLDKADIEKRYWAHYGSIRGKLGGGNNWGDFQSEMDAVNLKISEHEQHVKLLQSNIDIGMAKLAVHYRCCQMRITDLASHEMEVEIFGKKYYAETTDPQEYQERLTFDPSFEIDYEFDPEHESGDKFVAITEEVVALESAREKKKILQEISAIEGYATVRNDTELQKLITSCVEVGCNIYDYEQRLKALSSDEGEDTEDREEELSESLTDAQKEFATLKDKIKHVITFTNEFKKGAGNELITDEEWHAALQIMVEAQVKIDNGQGTASVLEDVIREQKARLAELIIERSAYKVENLHELGTWRIDAEGHATYALNVTDKELQEQMQRKLQTVYGYEAFHHMETIGSTNTGVMGIVVNSKPNKLKEKDWVLLNAGIAKRFAAYNSLSLHHDTRPATISAQVDAHSERLKNVGLTKANSENFNAAVDSLKAEISRVEAERVAEIQAIYQAHDAKLKQLVERFHDQQWGQLEGRAWQESSYKLAHPELQYPEDFNAEIRKLSDELRAKIKAVDEQEKYVHNKLYTENMELFGLERFASKIDLTSQQLSDEFKAKIKVNYAKDLALKTELDTINRDIKGLEQQVQVLLEKNSAANRRLIELTKNVTPAELAANQLEIDRIESGFKEIDLAQGELTSRLQGLLKNQMSCQRQRAQLHAQIELEKRQAMGLVPPAREDFLQNYRGYKEFLHNHQNLEQFSSEIAGLAAGDKASQNKLFGFAAEVISVLPTLGMPDVVDASGRSYSDEAVNDMVKSFLILDQARKAAERAIKSDPGNLYLKTLYEDLNNSFIILSNKILVHPSHEAMMGFELLPEDKRLEYIQKATQLDTSTESGREKARKLNSQIYENINQLQLATATEKLDAQLAQMGEVGRRIKEPENIKLYNGLINNEIVLNELLMMQKRLEEYLHNNDFSGNPQVEAAKKAELASINAEIKSMTALITTDLGKVFDLLGVKVDKQNIGEFLMQEAQHYFTRGAYVAGGAVAGYGIGQVGGLVCNLLGSLTGYNVLGLAGSALPYVGAAGGAWVGLEAGRLATQYDNSNISRVLTSKEFAEIEQTDKKFTSDKLLDSAELTKKLGDIKRNYIDGFKNVQQGIMHTIGNFINNHKLLFWGIVGVLAVAIGVAISVATMGAAAPIVAAAGAGVAAAVYGGCFAVGAAGTFGLGMWLKHEATMSHTQRIYNNAKAELDKVKKDLTISTIDLTHVADDPKLSSIIDAMNKHFAEQIKLIEARIMAHDPRSASMEDAKFKGELMRELYCLQEMKETKNGLADLLHKLDKNKQDNPALARAQQQELVSLLDTYLNHNYQVYHKTHVVDLSVESSKNAKTELGEHMQARGAERAKAMLTGSRKQYITAQFANSKEQERIQGELQRERAEVEKMSGIRQQLASLK